VTVARALNVDVHYAEELLDDLVEYQLAAVETGKNEPGVAFHYQVSPLLRASAAHLDGAEDLVAPDQHSKEGQATGGLAPVISH
jgi:hypothetical protein